MVTARLPREDAVRTLAHQMWEKEGRPDGKADEHWARASAAYDASASVVPVTQPVTQAVAAMAEPKKAQMKKATAKPVAKRRKT